MKETLLYIRAPKENEERGPLYAESAIAAIHSLKGADVPVSLEIGMGHDSKIGFFVRAARGAVRLTESQLYAQYPEIDIEYLKEDPFAVAEGEQVVSMDLVLTDPEVFPIKRHPQFDDMLTRVNVDPIAGITSTLAHYSVPGMRGHVGIVIKPLTGSFRRRSLRFLPLLTKGLSSISVKHAQLFTRVQLARGWKRLLYLPLAFFLGGFRAWPGVSKFAGKSLAAIESDSYDPDLQEEQQALALELGFSILYPSDTVPG